MIISGQNENYHMYALLIQSEVDINLKETCLRF